MSRRPPRALHAPVALVTVLVTGFALVLAVQSPTLATSANKPAPRAFVVRSTSTTTASLDWNKVAGASGYRVRYATSASMAHSSAATFRYNNGVVRGLKPGTRYWFRIAVAAGRGTGVAESHWTAAPYLSRTTRSLANRPPTHAPTPPASGRPYDLDVASYNISGVTNDRAGWNQPWAQRKDKVAQQLLGQVPADQPTIRPDVISLAEANGTWKYDGRTTQYADLVATLNRHVTGTDHYAGIDGITSMSTRIAYNDHTVTLLKAGSVKWAAQETAVDGLRYMAWGIFQVRSTGARFFFAANHLETASESVRRAQWEQLIREVPVLAQGLPVVLGGDFNSPRGAEANCADLPNPTANEMLPKMWSAGFGDTLGQLRCATRPTVSGSRAEHVVNGNVNSLTRYNPVLGHYQNTDIVGQDVDYIFASNNLHVKDWEMVLDKVQTGPDEYTLQGLVPSDHNLIKAVITLPGS